MVPTKSMQASTSSYNTDDLYQFFAVAFGAAPGVTYMGQLLDAANAGMSIKDIVNVFTTKDQFTSVYPLTLTNAEFATRLSTNVIGLSATDQAKQNAVNDIVQALASPDWTRGDVIFAVFTNLANKSPIDTEWGSTSKKMKNQVVFARYYTEVMKGDATTVDTLQRVIRSVTENTDVVNGIETAILASLNAAPIANAGVEQNVSTGSVVTLDGSASLDANGDLLTYAWTLTSKPAESSAVLSSATVDKPTFTADKVGTYLASLTVSDGRLSSSTVTVSIAATSVPATILNLPTHAISAGQLAVIVAVGDPLSEAIASYYQSARGIPAANIIRVTLTTGVDTISAADFANLKAQIDAALPSAVQATLLTWTAPSRVAGSCTMGITSALALGFDPKYCSGGTCLGPTSPSPYYDSESAQPWQDHKLRPSMMLGASTLAAAKALIDRGVQADASMPTGDGYLLQTSDSTRSVRASDYASLPARWSGNSGLLLNYIDNSKGAASDSLIGKSNVLFYFTGLVSVPNLTSNTWRPGAIADTLTSYGGYLPSGNGQMPITAWLDAGATGSYGTVEEPCNYPQKFSKASVLIDQYYRGATLIEAYWKSVQWPGQGLFIGEPLAQPFRDTPGFVIDAGQYLISTRALRANSTYSLQYLSTSTGSWVTLASFKLTRARPQSWRVALPPGNATQLRWLGPCPANTSLQCTLSTSN